MAFDRVMLLETLPSEDQWIRGYDVLLSVTDLDSYAHELERSRTYIIEKAVSTYFDTLDEMISDKRIDDLKAGKTEIYSLEEVAQRLGLN